MRRISEEAFLKRDERERVFRHLILPPGSRVSHHRRPTRRPARTRGAFSYLPLPGRGVAAHSLPRSRRAEGSLPRRCRTRRRVLSPARGPARAPARARPLGRLAPRDRSSRLRTRAPRAASANDRREEGSSEGSGSSLSRGGPTVGRRVAPGPPRTPPGRRRPPRGAWRWTPPIASPWTTSARA